MRRVILGLGGAILVLVAGYLALGVPNFGQLSGFLTGGNLSWTAVEAGMGVLLWLILIGLAIGLLGLAIKSAPARQRDPHQKSREAILLLVAGLIVLGVGMAHHYGSSPQQCCGSLQEASNNAQH